MTMKKTQTPFTATLDLNLAALKAASLVCWRDKSYPREILRYIAIEITPQGIFTIGLDGHQMVVFKAGEPLPDETPKILLIPVATLDLIKNVRHNDRCQVTYTGKWDGNCLSDDSHGTISANGVTYTFQACTSQYPDWRGIIPPIPETQTPATFNPIHIAQMEKVAATLTAGDSHAKREGRFGYTTFWQNDRHPALVSFPEGTEGFGLVMPLRPDADSKAPLLPEWTKKHVSPLYA